MPASGIGRGVGTSEPGEPVAQNTPAATSAPTRAPRQQRHAIPHRNPPHRGCIVARRVAGRHRSSIVACHPANGLLQRGSWIVCDTVGHERANPTRPQRGGPGSLRGRAVGLGRAGRETLQIPVEPRNTGVCSTSIVDPRRCCARPELSRRGGSGLSGPARGGLDVLHTFAVDHDPAVSVPCPLEWRRAMRLMIPMFLLAVVGCTADDKTDSGEVDADTDADSDADRSDYRRRILTRIPIPMRIPIPTRTPTPTPTPTRLGQRHRYDGPDAHPVPDLR